MSERQGIVLMASESLRDSQRKAAALQSDALAQLVGNSDHIDLHEMSEPESWSDWWQDMLATAVVTLVLIPDGSMLGFRQDQRAERAQRQGVPVYVLWQPNGTTWQLTPRRDVDIRPMRPSSLAQFAQLEQKRG